MPRDDRIPIRIGNGAGFWGDNLDAPVTLVKSRQTRRADAGISRRVDPRDPRPSTLEGPGGGLRDRSPRFARASRAGDDRAGKPFDRHERGRVEPESLRRPVRDDPRSGRDGSHSRRGRRAGMRSGHAFHSGRPTGSASHHMETGEPIGSVLDRIVSANAYLGARPIATAAQERARLVITGRVADASLTLGPAAAHFGWAWDDMDEPRRGARRRTSDRMRGPGDGGLWSRWQEIPDLAGVGYPIAEYREMARVRSPSRKAREGWSQSGTWRSNWSTRSTTRRAIGRPM